MSGSVVRYDKDLPEIPDRAGSAHLPPQAYLLKIPGTEEFQIVPGRRPSKLLLVNNLRRAVSKWRADSYPGSSQVTRRLFGYWFEDDHEVDGKLFRYYFGQREAIETLAFLMEIEKTTDNKKLVDRFGEVFQPLEGTGLIQAAGITHEATVAGRRRIRRYLPELDGYTIQDLAAENVSRLAFKMATGSGKTVVMAMAAVWSYFHARQVPDSILSANFLLTAPNIIVYQRLEKDFGSNRIFHQLPLIPPDWLGDWHMKVILRGETAEPQSSGNFFLTNVQQLYQNEATGGGNPVEELLGRRPVMDLAANTRPLLERIASLTDLVVLNDEAHHLHDEELQWPSALLRLHNSMPGGLSLWLDFSATPKDQNGSYFPWIVTDYPLAQAVEDRIVKAPLIVHRVQREDPHQVTRENVVEAYGHWLMAALARWREHSAIYKSLNQKPVLFIMAEKNVFADAIARWLVTNPEIKLNEEEVLVIHTDSEGDVTKADLDVARQLARDIDHPDNKVKVIVSVMMLREGWDVRNVTVVLGLRPFTSSARILPEQAVGRGLRLMTGIGPDRTQTLEVLGTDAFEAFVRQLETEGLGIGTTTKPPPPPVNIHPLRDRMGFDIRIPITSPTYERNYRDLAAIDPLLLSPIFAQSELDEPLRLRLQMEFATVGTQVHQVDVVAGELPLAQELLASITRKVIANARLGGVFAELYPIVRTYVAKRCFGTDVDLDKEESRSHLRSPLLQEGVARYLASQIGRLTVQTQTLRFANRWLQLSDTLEFTWRRNLPLVAARKTVFNLVATYNDFEKGFALFLDRCKDVPRFAALGTTEQDSGSTFRVDYVKPSGAIGFYYPDWVVVQTLPDAPTNWIVETKGRVWEDTPAKDAAITYWCNEVSVLTQSIWRFVRVNQADFNPYAATGFADCLRE